MWISNNITQKLLPIVSNLCDGSVLFKYLLDHNIKDLYDLYCKERHLKSKIINISEYNYLKKILNNKKSGEIVAILYGLTGFPRYILPASYIIDLINQCAIYVASEDMWEYIHAIMPFTLDLHNIDYGNHHIIECYYYRHKGNVPTSCSSLFDVWEYLHSNCHKKSTDKYKVDECYICFDDLCITQELYQCKQCEKILHKNCFKKYWKTSNKQNCPHCQKNLNLLRIGLNNTQDIAII